MKPLICVLSFLPFQDVGAWEAAAKWEKLISNQNCKTRRKKKFPQGIIFHGNVCEGEKLSCSCHFYSGHERKPSSISVFQIPQLEARLNRNLDSRIDSYLILFSQFVAYDLRRLFVRYSSIYSSNASGSPFFLILGKRDGYRSVSDFSDESACSECRWFGFFLCSFYEFLGNEKVYGKKWCNQIINFDPVSTLCTELVSDGIVPCPFLRRSAPIYLNVAHYIIDLFTLLIIITQTASMYIF